MWIIYKEECRKITSRKIVWISLLCLMLFTALHLKTRVSEYETIIDGKVYTGAEGIQKDRELAKEYAGTFTLEKAMNIKKRFGFAHIDEEGWLVGNYCSRFITEYMSNYRETSTNTDEIQFYEGEDWDDNAAFLVSGKITFGYTYGWGILWELWMLIGVGLMIIFIIGLAPVFSEEYSLRTANLLLATDKGRKQGTIAKLLACFSFTSVVTAGVWLFLGTIYALSFGTDGLDASGRLLFQMPFKELWTCTVAECFLIEMAMFFMGLLFLLAITALVSACSRNTFLSAVVSLLFFVIPYIWVKQISPLLFPARFIRLIGHFMFSMPILLPLNWGCAFQKNPVILHFLIAASGTLLCAVAACRKYQNYEGQ